MSASVQSARSGGARQSPDPARKGMLIDAKAPAVVVERDHMRVQVDGTALPLTPVEFRLLAEMIEHPNASIASAATDFSQKISATSTTASTRISKISAANQPAATMPMPQRFTGSLSLRVPELTRRRYCAPRMHTPCSFSVQRTMNCCYVHCDRGDLHNVHAAALLCSYSPIFNQKAASGNHHRAQSCSCTGTTRARSLSIDLDPQAQLMHHRCPSQFRRDTVLSLFQRTDRARTLRQAHDGHRCYPSHMELSKVDSLYGKGYNVAIAQRQPAQ